MRRSYRKLMSQPAWLLLDENKKIVASVRARTAGEAKHLFKAHGLRGKYLRRAKS